MADAYYFKIDREGMGPILQFFHDDGPSGPILVDSWAFAYDGPNDFYDAIADLVDKCEWYQNRHAQQMETIIKSDDEVARLRADLAMAKSGAICQALALRKRIEELENDLEESECAYYDVIDWMEE